MKFSLFFDLAMVVSGNGIPDRKATEAMMESVKTNPRAGRYFHKAFKDPLEGIPEEDIVEDLPKDTEDPAEEKPIGDEIPNPTVDMEDSPKNEEVDPIETPIPSTEDEDDEYAQESTEEEEEEEDTESHMSDELKEDVAALEDLLNAFSNMDEEEVEEISQDQIDHTYLTDVMSRDQKTAFEKILNRSENDQPAEEAVGRETPAIPSVLREVEAEDDETPIPLNVSVEINKETADMKVNKTTYVDKVEDKDLAKVRKMISDFAMAPTTKKKELANEIYCYVLDHNVDIDLRKYRMIWKLVDKPFITSKKEEE